MSEFNPFDHQGMKMEAMIRDWRSLNPLPYHKSLTDPYTKTRIILMNGIEVEAALFLHQFHRHCQDNDLRRELAMTRRIEQQQQKVINWQPPADESTLEITIGYEHVAVDLTAWLAQNEPDPYVKQALDFALLEDFDHLYRYANLLEMDYGIKAHEMVGEYVEIMPGRPTIVEHRHPFESVNRPVDFKQADILTKLNTLIITAGEQQTMNFYMNVGNRYPTDIGRGLYLEIGMIEEQHVSHYGALIDPTTTWLENLLLHDYAEAYLYYSFYEEEKNPAVKLIWEEHLNMEIGHLHKAARLLQKYEGKEWSDLLPPHFPRLLHMQSNLEYVRKVLAGQVYLGKDREDYVNVSELKQDHDYFRYQKLVNGNDSYVPSHNVIEASIAGRGTDYRFQTAEHPVPELQNRAVANKDVGRRALSRLH